MKHKGFRILVGLFVVNILYHIILGIIYSEILSATGGESRMLIMEIAFWQMGFITVIMGYVLLFLKLRIGRIILIFYYIFKEIILFINTNLGREFDFLVIFEMIFWLTIIFILMFSKNIDNYILLKKEKKYKKCER